LFLPVIARSMLLSFFLSSFLTIFFLILMDSDGWVHAFPDFLLLCTETTAAERLKKWSERLCRDWCIWI
jgi:hypothetical protein